MANLPLPQRMFCEGGEPDKGKVQTYFLLKDLDTVKDALKKHENEWSQLWHSQFRYLLEHGREVPFSVKFAHFMLSRQLVTKKKHEIWMQFGGAPIRFSIQEFSAATGLNCSKIPKIPEAVETTNWNELIGNDVAEIDANWIEQKLKSKKFNDPRKRLQLCCLLLVDALLCPTNRDRKISQKHVELVRDVNKFLDYPWGRRAFSLAMKSIKTRGAAALCQDTLAIQGFLHGMQLAMLKCIPAIETRILDKHKAKKKKDASSDGEVDDNKPLAIQMSEIRKLYNKRKPPVTATLPVVEESEDDLKFDDEVEDTEVNNLLERITNGPTFTTKCWSGGKHFEDVTPSKRHANQKSVTADEVHAIAQEYVAAVKEMESRLTKDIEVLRAELAKMKSEIKSKDSGPDDHREGFSTKEKHGEDQATATEEDNLSDHGPAYMEIQDRPANKSEGIICVDDKDSHSSKGGLPESLPEKKILYPPWDKKGGIEVSSDDLDCLAPGKKLSSNIMNFYIRFLQEKISSANQIYPDYHFFNTFFYGKITDTFQGNDEDKLTKLRKWWKGIDLFRKPYVIMAIHGEDHWSLVIVSIPDKEEELGPTILHLDSAVSSDRHSKREIVGNVKRFLRDEWNYLNKECSSSDLPLSEKIWKSFPDKIKEADIQVPQQTNSYDCGLFVLFYIKRFIEEAPQRLKTKDLEMFGKNWFRPEEACALRTEIHDTLANLLCLRNETGFQNDLEQSVDVKEEREQEQPLESVESEEEEQRKQKQRPAGKKVTFASPVMEIVGKPKGRHNITSLGNRGKIKVNAL